MRIETRKIFSGLVSDATPNASTHDFLCKDELEIKKATCTNIDANHRHLTAWVIRRGQQQEITDANLILKDFQIDAGKTFDISVLNNHCLEYGDKLYFKSSTANVLILNVSGIAYREDL